MQKVRRLSFHVVNFLAGCGAGPACPQAEAGLEGVGVRFESNRASERHSRAFQQARREGSADKTMGERQRQPGGGTKLAERPTDDPAQRIGRPRGAAAPADTNPAGAMLCGENQVSVAFHVYFGSKLTFFPISSLQEHVASIDSLRDELNILSDKNTELERRLHMAASERDSLASALEEASDRILGLERHAREQELRWQHSLREYDLPQEKLSIEERLASK